MDSWLFYLLLYVMALGLYILEVFIPSGGLIGIGATLCLFYSLWQLSKVQPWLTLLLVLFTLAYIYALVRWGLRRFSMNEDLAGGVATGRDVQEAESLIGTVGEAISALRPAGVARINGRKFDVVTQGAFIEAGHPVEVIETTGNRIVVKAR